MKNIEDKLIKWFCIIVAIAVALVISYQVFMYFWGLSFVEGQINTKEWVLYDSDTSIGHLTIYKTDGSTTISDAVNWYLDNQHVHFTNDYYKKDCADTFYISNSMVITDFGWGINKDCSMPRDSIAIIVKDVRVIPMI